MISKKILQLTHCLLLLIPALSVAADNSPYHVNVHVGKDLKQFKLEYCFSQPTNGQALFLSDIAKKPFTPIRHISRHKSRLIKPEQLQQTLKTIQAGDCLQYTARFNGNITYPRYSERQSTRQQILVRLDQWLLQPQQTATQMLTINYYLPDKMEISAPGHLVKQSTNKRVYRISTQSMTWNGCIAIGHFKLIERQKNKANIHIALLNNNSSYPQQDIIRWVDANLNSLYQVYDQLPVDDLQIIVVPVGHDREPVPWAQVMRGGGNAVHLYIDETRPATEFMNDWVLAHELSHLLHPRLTAEGKWISEGMASYYQNVLRARSGLLTQEQAWTKMLAGFERGRQGTSHHNTLKQDSETMMRNRAFMRVYWSGAAISLMADTQLRRQSNNKQSLDTVLKKFKDCCLPTHNPWSAQRFIAKLDELSNSKIFSSLYNKYAYSKDFPDLQTSLSHLSIGNDMSHFSITKADNPVRNSIMEKIF